MQAPLDTFFAGFVHGAVAAPRRGVDPAVASLVFSLSEGTPEVQEAAAVVPFDVVAPGIPYATGQPDLATRKPSDALTGFEFSVVDTVEPTDAQFGRALASGHAVEIDAALAEPPPTIRLGTGLTEGVSSPHQTSTGVHASPHMYRPTGTGEPVSEQAIRMPPALGPARVPDKDDGSRVSSERQAARAVPDIMATRPADDLRAVSRDEPRPRAVQKAAPQSISKPEPKIAGGQARTAPTRPDARNMSPTTVAVQKQAGASPAEPVAKRTLPVELRSAERAMTALASLAEPAFKRQQSPSDSFRLPNPVPNANSSEPPQPADGPASMLPEQPSPMKDPHPAITIQTGHAPHAGTRGTPDETSVVVHDAPPSVASNRQEGAAAPQVVVRWRTSPPTNPDTSRIHDARHDLAEKSAESGWRSKRPEASVPADDVPKTVASPPPPVTTANTGLHSAHAAPIPETRRFQTTLDDSATAELLNQQPASTDTAIQKAVDSEQRPNPAGRPAIAQIADAVRAQSDGTVEVKLSPEELGRVKMSFTPGDGGLSVHLVAERAETLDLLRRHADMLAAELTDAGYSGLQFTFGQEGGAGPGERNAHAERSDPGEKMPEPIPAHTPPATRPEGLSGGLDIRL